MTLITRKRSLALIVIVCGGALALSGQTHSSPRQDAEIPEAMARLQSFEGRWEAPEVEFLDAQGEVVRTSAAEARNGLTLDGLVLEHSGRLRDPVIATRGWYYWDPADERLHMGSVSSRGFYDHFVGGWEGDRLVMATDSRVANGGPLFRMIHDDITADSYSERLEMSRDGGETWRVSSRQTFRRVGARQEETGPEILDALGSYAGHWRAEDRTDQQGNPFHFEYELRWLDSGQTIAELAITRVAPSGTTVIFKGFKGRDPHGGVYYFGASPSGRGARGEVVLEGRKLVTIYDGWDPDGNLVEIRDVFEPPSADGDAFVSRTFLRQSPDEDWRQIGEDHWRRTDS